jgi:biopolymer transport protein ExbD
MSTLPSSMAPGDSGVPPFGAGPEDTPRRSIKHFRRRDALHNYSLHFGPNMTPMVDVVMVILIFFMAFAAFMGNEWFLRAGIPGQSGRGKDASKLNDPNAPPPTQLKVVLDADAAGNTVVSFLGFQRVSMEEFEKRINEFPRSEATRNIQVLLAPTARVAYADVVRAHAACDAVGIYQVGYSPAGTTAEAPK